MLRLSERLGSAFHEDKTRNRFGIKSEKFFKEDKLLSVCVRKVWVFFYCGHIKLTILTSFNYTVQWY